MLGALACIQDEISRRTIQPPWPAYQALAHHLERFHLWFPAIRDRVRLLHRPNIPQLEGRAITSYIEAANEICNHRVQWLRHRIDWPLDAEGQPNTDQALDWCGKSLAADADYIYSHWPFPVIDFHDLQVGIQLECTGLDEPKVPRTDRPVDGTCHSSSSATGRRVDLNDRENVSRSGRPGDNAMASEFSSTAEFADWYFGSAKAYAEWFANAARLHPSFSVSLIRKPTLRHIVKDGSEDACHHFNRLANGVFDFLCDVGKVARDADHAGALLDWATQWNLHALACRYPYRFRDGTSADEWYDVAGNAFTICQLAFETLASVENDERLMSEIHSPPNLKPAWNRDTGDLLVGGKLAKRIRNLRQAKNVVEILDSFQRDQWPDRIDDPLPFAPERKRNERLSDAIKSLNENLSLISFQRDGQTTGIVWRRS